MGTKSLCKEEEDILCAPTGEAEPQAERKEQRAQHTQCFYCEDEKTAKPRAGLVDRRARVFRGFGITIPGGRNFCIATHHGNLLGLLVHIDTVN